MLRAPTELLPRPHYFLLSASFPEKKNEHNLLWKAFLFFSEQVESTELAIFDAPSTKAGI